MVQVTACAIAIANPQRRQAAGSMGWCGPQR